jgi:hypothetical protein
VTHLSQVIKEGRAGPKVRKGIEDAVREMRAIADNIRGHNPKAGLIDRAREKFEGLIEAAIEKEREREKDKENDSRI